MHLIVVNRDAPVCFGLLVEETREASKRREDWLKRAKDSAAPLQRMLGDKNHKGGVFKAALGMMIVGAPIASLATEAARVEHAFEMGVDYARQVEFLERYSDRVQTVGRSRVIPLEALPEFRPLSFERNCITICRTPSVGVLPEFDDVRDILFGAISSPEQWEKTMNADGGTSRVHVFNLSIAREHLKRHGGGIIEEGVYVLHPKREGVLVPFRSFHMEMLQEMTREARVVMGRLGARKLIVDTVDGVNFAGNLRGKGVKASAQGSSDKQDRVSFEWATPTFEPQAALDGCVWIQDNADVMTIVDQRRISDLTRYEQYSRVNTSFSLSLDVVKAFNAGFSWSNESTYSYEVEFFPRPS